VAERKVDPKGAYRPGSYVPAVDILNGPFE